MAVIRWTGTAFCNVCKAGINYDQSTSDQYDEFIKWHKQETCIAPNIQQLCFEELIRDITSIKRPIEWFRWRGYLRHEAFEKKVEPRQ